MIGIQVDLPKHIHREVEIIAKLEKKSISRVIREIMAREIKERLHNAS